MSTALWGLALVRNRDDMQDTHTITAVSLRRRDVRGSFTTVLDSWVGLSKAMVLSRDDFALPEDTWQCVEIFLVVIFGER